MVGHLFQSQTRCITHNLYGLDAVEREPLTKRKRLAVQTYDVVSTPGSSSTRIKSESPTTQHVSFARSNRSPERHYQIAGPTSAVVSLRGFSHTTLPASGSLILLNTEPVDRDRSIETQSTASNSQLSNMTNRRLPSIRSILPGSWTTSEGHHSASYYESSSASSSVSYEDEDQE